MPRLWTPPLRDLTPATSYGFELNEFAESIGEPFDPWQEWLSIHVGELLPDGSPRFRTILVLVSRQNGKTRFAKVWALWNLFVDMAVPGRYENPTLLGISSKLDYAKETWAAAVASARNRPILASEMPRNGVRESNGEQCLTTDHGTRYKIAASNEDAGRSLTVHRLIVDELRRQTDYTAWNAAEPTTTAVDDAQIIALSNQGDDRSVVLDGLRSAALAYIETGEGDDSLGLFEWSAPDGSKPTDIPALLQANPNVGYRVKLRGLLGRAKRAEAAGGEELAGFLTESMCMRVHQMNPAIDPGKWAGCYDAGSMNGLRDRVALCLDVAIDLSCAVLVAAAVMPDGRVRVEVVKMWSGQGCTQALRRELPGVFDTWKVKPRVLGWFPNGPAAAVAADIADRKRNGKVRGQWPPRGVTVEEIRQETTAVCMGLAALVTDTQVAHSDDEFLNTQVQAAQKLYQGDAWRFARRGSAPIAGAYATAGAVHLAKTLPPSIGRPRIVA